MDKLVTQDPLGVLELLQERLTFERLSTDLCETVLARLGDSDQHGAGPIRDSLRELRLGAAASETWLLRQVRTLGGDPGVALEEARELRSRGGEGLPSDDAPLAEVMRGLVVAKLADCAGWELLRDAALDADDDVAAAGFQTFLEREETHLHLARLALAWADGSSLRESAVAVSA